MMLKMRMRMRRWLRFDCQGRVGRLCRLFRSLGMVWLPATPEQCEMTEEARGSTSSQHITAPQSDVDADHRALCDHNKRLPVSLPAY